MKGSQNMSWHVFGPGILQSVLRLVKRKAQQTLTPAAKSVTDLTATPCFWLANHGNRSRCFAISSLPPICSPNFSFMGELGNKSITKLGYEKYFCRVAHWALSTAQDALSVCWPLSNLCRSFKGSFTVGVSKKGRRIGQKNLELCFTNNIYT
jgi:hypothetical protein